MKTRISTILAAAALMIVLATNSEGRAGEAGE